MSMSYAFVVPHPPILITGIGKGEEHCAQSTLDAYHDVARAIAELSPQTIVIATPHGRIFRDSFHITAGTSAKGDFRDFRHSGNRLQIDLDSEFAEALVKQAASRTIPCECSHDLNDRLDHGCMVPLHFITQYLRSPFTLLRVSISLLDELQHYHFGECITQVAEQLKRTVVFIASGDLSHRLKEDGPYGFNSAGPLFDAQVTAALSESDFMRLMRFDADFREDAGECGLNSCIMMAGALDGRAVRSRLHSYEGPWGVGYAVASFEPLGEDPERRFAVIRERQLGLINLFNNTKTPERQQEASRSLPVQLAFAALRDYLHHDSTPSPDTPYVSQLLDSIRDDSFHPQLQQLAELSQHRAGVFVSFKINGELRGCIGTIEHTSNSIVDEILQNTVSAAANDPRFPAITEDEIAALECSVDILGEAEPIDSQLELDPKRYGVIVTHGLRRGLLLPDLEGVDTPELQVAIALQKAGIRADKPYRLQRFEVTRYT
ncbi:MAG: AmmeMemoRadiSam system protein A [Coriobacteriaceae bacterium]|nr:AmmeMemoRadiSam system protein A [Coriobacteriaceae bacterium]